ncbi:MAG: tRNA (adenosine(37)-N6)-dimethylallyltransferase MiaA, partial [Gammaproteobacteria bacterium]|nr:tRNA (adenosine(37)-N6)-dimethylallyltransferase MiaA [Gammaproteobacteria bacterium]
MGSFSVDSNRSDALLFLTGPTAAGKTALAVELVERYPFEIISVDSALVYRGMDIGTAKPDAETLQRAPHRLIDLLEPEEPYSAARFREDALSEINAIRQNGNVPLLVGGTMLYYRALQFGLSRLPASDPEIRGALEQQRAKEGLAPLYRRLQRVDPIAAARIHAHDSQRIQRALEVFEMSGIPLTTLQQQQQAEAMNPAQIQMIAVAPKDRSVLHQRIEQRLGLMMEQGFVEEVEQLRQRQGL